MTSTTTGSPPVRIVCKEPTGGTFTWRHKLVGTFPRGGSVRDTGGPGLYTWTGLLPPSGRDGLGGRPCRLNLLNVDRPKVVLFRRLESHHRTPALGSCLPFSRSSYRHGARWKKAHPSGLTPVPLDNSLTRLTGLPPGHYRTPEDQTTDGDKHKE